MDKKVLLTLKSEIETKRKSLNMLIGMDGFVDEIVHVVDKRTDFENFERLGTIEEFGKKVSHAAGLSANFELVPAQVKLGGNGPIFANALIEYGVDVTYVGALGFPDIHPVFKPMADKCSVFSLCEPGHTDAVEFYDGKLMLGKIATIKNIRWEKMKEVMGGVSQIAQRIGNCDLLGLENWTMVPYMNEIWEGLIDEVFPLLPTKDVLPLAFFDLADPEKRTKEDILVALKLISQFGAKFRVVLGLNEKEAYEIAEVFDIVIDKTKADALEAVVTKVYKKLNIHCLVVHPTKCAAACTKEGYFFAEGPYCEKPVLTTGAGDNFNAGFCFGMSLGLTPLQALYAGVCTSGFYVRNAKSPNYNDLIHFVDSILL